MALRCNSSSASSRTAPVLIKAAAAAYRRDCFCGCRLLVSPRQDVHDFIIPSHMRPREEAHCTQKKAAAGCCIHLLAGELPVYGAKGLQLVLRCVAVLRVQVHLQAISSSYDNLQHEMGDGPRHQHAWRSSPCPSCRGASGEGTFAHDPCTRFNSLHHACRKLED